MDSTELAIQAIEGELSIDDHIHILETKEDDKKKPAEIISGKLDTANFNLKKTRRTMEFILRDRSGFSTGLDKEVDSGPNYTIIFGEHMGEYFTSIFDLEGALRRERVEFTENLFKYLKSFGKLPADLYMKPKEVFNKANSGELNIGDQVFELSSVEGSLEITSGKIYQLPTGDDKSMKLSNKMSFFVDMNRIIDYEKEGMLHIMWSKGTGEYFTDVDKLREALKIYDVAFSDNLCDYLDTLSQNQEIED